jgi:4-amino-4-deoxy-L-arabinose transferase-like glycosyltransferase
MRRPRLAALGPPRFALLVVILVACAIRVVHFALVPLFTDESLEVLWSLSIARGQAFPLTNYDAYYGALFNYLVAGAFLLFGPAAEVARLVPLAAGLLTVPATYLLARAWASGRTPAGGAAGAGLLAAALLAVSGAHVVINSHIAWANCTTPLFTTLATWALYRAVTEPGADLPSGARWRSGLFFPLSGLFWGLALQTHPLVATLLPGAALYVAWVGRSRLRTPWPYLGLLAFLLGYANVLAHNLAGGFESLTSAQRIRQDYATDDDAANSYAEALGMALLLLARVLGGAIDARAWPAGYLLDPAVLLASALALAGLVWQARRGNPLPLLLVISCLLLLPAVNPKFRTLISSRYVMPLAPLLLASLAGPLAAALWSPRQAGAARLLHWLALAATLVLLIAPLAPLSRYYARAFAEGDTNQRVYRLADEVARTRQPLEPIILDESFGSESGGVSELRALRYLLALQDLSTTVLKLTPKRLEDQAAGTTGGSLLVVLDGRQVREFERLPLQPLTPTPSRGAEVGLFRLTVPLSRRADD